VATTAANVVATAEAAAKEVAQAALTPLLTGVQGFLPTWKTGTDTAVADAQAAANALAADPTLITDATWLADMNAKSALVRTAAANAVAQADTLDATTDAAAKEGLGTLATGLTGLADNLDAALTAGDAAAVAVAIAAIDVLNKDLGDFETTLTPTDAGATTPEAGATAVAPTNP